jgi:predicted RecB family endonuclease
MQTDFPIKTLDELKSLAAEMKWQWFEKLVGWIFEQNGFRVVPGKVEIFDDGKRQFDVIAERHGRLFAVECKKWKGGRYKKSQLVGAAKCHGERCGLLSVKRKKIAFPLIVTLMDEDVVSHGGVFVVPIEKLNTFINTFEELI